MTEDLIVSADGHYVEPTDLFTTRLPKLVHDLAVWEEDFDVAALGRARSTPTSGSCTRRASRGGPTCGTATTTGPRRPAIRRASSRTSTTRASGRRCSIRTTPCSGCTPTTTTRSRSRRPRLQRLRRRGLAPYRDRVFTTSPIPLSDLDDAVAEIERVATAAHGRSSCPRYHRSRTAPERSIPCGRPRRRTACSSPSMSRPAA